MWIWGWARRGWNKTAFGSHFKFVIFRQLE